MTLLARYFLVRRCVSTSSHQRQVKRMFSELPHLRTDDTTHVLIALTSYSSAVGDFSKPLLMSNLDLDLKPSRSSFLLTSDLANCCLFVRPASAQPCPSMNPVAGIRRPVKTNVHPSATRAARRIPMLGGGNSMLSRAPVRDFFLRSHVSDFQAEEPHRLHISMNI